MKRYLSLVLLAAAACQGSTAAGPGESCGPDRGCEDGLTCHAGICVVVGEGDTGASALDAGHGSADATAGARDANATIDSGAPVMDASAVDASHAPDAAGSNDAGARPDATTELSDVGFATRDASSLDASPGPGDSGMGVDSGAPTIDSCAAHTWKPAVPAAGGAMMAFGQKAYLFDSSGLSWATIENGFAVTQAIPLPAGVTKMTSVIAELAPSGRPFVTFFDGSQDYGAFFDGQAFVGLTALGQVSGAHADAQERIYALTTNGLTEFGPGGPFVRGALPNQGVGWTVGADGTVYQLFQVSRPSTIHPGDTAIDLHLTHLPHGSLTWTGDVVVSSNEGYGFGGILFAAAPDGSLHAAYGLTYEAYYFHSTDGVTWANETFKDIISKANLVDHAAPFGDDDPAEVKGNLRLLAPRDYDHATIVLVYAQGSFSVPGFYVLRRCPPFGTTGSEWPADRLAFSGMAFDPGEVAVSELGYASVLTPAGVRQDVPDGVTGPSPAPVPPGSCGSGCAAALPACSALASVQLTLPTGADLLGYPSSSIGPLLLLDTRAFVFLEGAPMWMTAAQGSAVTAALPATLAGGQGFASRTSLSGETVITFSDASQTLAVNFDGASFGAAVQVPAGEARAAGDGHLWIYGGGVFYEQAAQGFANRGGGPVAPSLWDVDSAGTVWVLGSGDATEVLAIWKLSPGASGWTKAGSLKKTDVAAIGATIEGGFQLGADGPGVLAVDGSFHLFSDARCIGTGDHNKVQAWARSKDGVSWDVQALPSADSLTGGLLTWKDLAFWAADYDKVRYVTESSPAPQFDGSNWYYPDRRFDLIARCLDGKGQPTFARVASVPLPGWTDPGFTGFSPFGLATMLTGKGLTQVAW